MSNPCQQCLSEYDVFTCHQCGEELCEDCSVNTADGSCVCPSCVEGWNREHMDEYRNMRSEIIHLKSDIRTLIKIASGLHEGEAFDFMAKDKGFKIRISDWQRERHAENEKTIQYLAEKYK